MKRSCGNGPSNQSWGGGQPTPYGANMMNPMSTGGGMNPNMVGPASTGALNPIIAPEQTIYKNFYHTASQPIVHPVNVVNQHHTIPVPQHFCTYNVKDVNCGVKPIGGCGCRSTRKGRR